MIFDFRFFQKICKGLVLSFAFAVLFAPFCVSVLLCKKSPKNVFSLNWTTPNPDTNLSLKQMRRWHSKKSTHHSRKPERSWFKGVSKFWTVSPVLTSQSVETRTVKSVKRLATDRKQKALSAENKDATNETHHTVTNWQSNSTVQVSLKLWLSERQWLLDSR